MYLYIYTHVCGISHSLYVYTIYLIKKWRIQIICGVSIWQVESIHPCLWSSIRSISISCQEMRTTSRNRWTSTRRCQRRDDRQHHQSTIRCPQDAKRAVQSRWESLLSTINLYDEKKMSKKRRSSTSSEHESNALLVRRKASCTKSMGELALDD